MPRHTARQLSQCNPHLGCKVLLVGTQTPSCLVALVRLQSSDWSPKRVVESEAIPLPVKARTEASRARFVRCWEDKLKHCLWACL